ncbi:hypothetical protein DBN75_03600 [Enterococcus faecalis]|uniref:Uncharacterized protein n=2 Tax=Enterococcus faecalis TaxID=1351 RepID=Q832H7_ENTFA|nr:hypothetical protein EF_2251 [Enterococcus faecalis V583]AQL54158.1 hypothetical protein BZG32_10815 [Enterococcus faecalis]EET98780.1 hypothetical protein EFBG_00518 [Enterococcus faecalis T2]AXG88983.1 hypothetical protein DTO64_10605 [Enterococcus faecalis]KGQ71937.1 hypothetical protein NZ06_15725 [Enterococcus faecalis]
MPESKLEDDVDSTFLDEVVFADTITPIIPCERTKPKHKNNLKDLLIVILLFYIIV